VNVLNSSSEVASTEFQTGSSEYANYNQVLSALSAQSRTPGVRERRMNQRFPYPRLIRLTPLGPGGEPLVDETETVVGKNLSQVGVGFFHQQALPYRRVIVSLESPDGGWIAFLTDLTWRRFAGGGWYDSGGRFLKAMESPLPRAAQSRNAPNR
jgi:hypothetical protein